MELHSGKSQITWNANTESFSRSRIIWVLAALLLTRISLTAQPENESLLLFDFENGFDLLSAEKRDADIELTGNAQNQLLQINSKHHISGPGITLFAPGDPWNLNGYYQVKMDVANTGKYPMQVIMQVGNPEDGMEAWQMQTVIDLEPGATKTAVNKITTTPWMFSEPLELAGMRAAPGQAKTDLQAIDRIIISVRYADKNHSFTIDNIQAEGKVDYIDPQGFLPFIDKFGQMNHQDWPGKIHSGNDLSLRGEAEHIDLSAHPGPIDFNLYGGWKAGPRFEATGFFRTQKYNGAWWLVDPEGCLFWSHGVCCVHPGSATTGITDREAYFEELPSKDDPLGQFYGRAGRASHGHYKNREVYTTFDFTRANLYRKYGEDWPEEFNQLTHTRLRSWGMNTCGIASSKDLYMQNKTPFVATVWVRNQKKIEASSGYWGKFHDVFDPEFRKAVKKAISYKKEEAKNPWCIGFFVENELSWGRDGSLSLATLASSAEQAAKQVFVKDLKQKYSRIEKLNDSWGTNHESWEALLQSRDTPDKEKAWEDLKIFYDKIAVTYFSTVREEMDRVAPNILYLGCRLAWANSDIVIRTAARYCDVISFNKYEYSVEDMSLPAGVDKPIIIGEFHFGALDRGSYHKGIKEARDQEHRGVLYKNYVQGALRNPLIVGTHWFQYVDQAPTGRGDGENYNVGLVDICDTPFPEVIDDIRETGYQLYKFRLKNARNSGTE